MTASFATVIKREYMTTHRRILEVSTVMSNEQLHWRGSPNSHTSAFHLWHVARWADVLQASIPGMTPTLTNRLGAGNQVWDAEGLAGRWGFDRPEFGYAATGMGMSDDLARAVAFPEKAAMLAYFQAVLAAIERTLTAIDDDQFAAAEQWQPMTDGIWSEGTVGNAILAHVLHANRHLGAMECLFGQQTGAGTATV